MNKKKGHKRNASDVGPRISVDVFDDVDGPQFSRMPGKHRHDQSVPILDEMDGAQFSRIREEKKKHKDKHKHKKSKTHSGEVNPQMNRVQTCPTNDLHLERPQLKPIGINRQRSYSNSDLDKVDKSKYMYLKPKVKETQSNSSNSMCKDGRLTDLGQKRNSCSGNNLKEKKRAQFVRHKYNDKLYPSGDESDGGQFERKNNSKVFSPISNKDNSYSTSSSLRDTKELSSIIVESNEDLRKSTGCLMDNDRTRNASGTPMRDVGCNDSRRGSNVSGIQLKDLSNGNHDNDSIPDFYIPHDFRSSDPFAIANNHTDLQTDPEQRLEINPMLPKDANKRNFWDWEERPRRYITKTIPALFSAVLFLLDVGTDIKLAATYRNAGKLLFLYFKQA